MKRHMYNWFKVLRSAFCVLWSAFLQKGRVLVCLLSLFFCCNVHVFAQYTGYALVSNLPEFKKRFAIESGKISTITSGFTQEKILTALTEKITSRGSFKFKRSDKV